MTPAGRFRGKGVLVVGGLRGTGRAVALAALEQGAEVLVAGREAAEPDLPSVIADPAREDDVERVFEMADERLPGLDALVYAEPATSARPFADTTLAEWNAALASTLRGFFLTTRRALEDHLATGRRGRIVAVAPAVDEGAEGQAPAAAAQAAMLSLARSITKEYGRRGIACNLVLAPPAAHARGDARLVDAILFLASEEASYVNGEALRVSG